VELWLLEALATAPTTGESDPFAHVVSVTLPAAQVNGYPHEILAGHRTVKVGAKVRESRVVAGAARAQLRRNRLHDDPRPVDRPAAGPPAVRVPAG